MMTKIEVEKHFEKLTFQLMNRQKVRMWSACRWRIKNQELFFEVKGLLFSGTVELTLNLDHDAYNVYLVADYNRLHKYIPNVDGRDLVRVLDTNIENPMDGTYFSRIKQLYLNKK